VHLLPLLLLLLSFLVWVAVQLLGCCCRKKGCLHNVLGESCAEQQSQHPLLLLLLLLELQS
jgi:hypothetical protein